MSARLTPQTAPQAAPHLILHQETVRAAGIARQQGRRGCRIRHYGPWTAIQADDPELRASIAASIIRRLRSAGADRREPAIIAPSSAGHIWRRHGLQPDRHLETCSRQLIVVDDAFNTLRIHDIAETLRGQEAVLLLDTQQNMPRVARIVQPLLPKAAYDLAVAA